MKKPSLTLILLIVVLVGAVFVYFYNPTPVDKPFVGKNTTNISEPNPDANSGEVKAYFDTLVAVPYEAHYVKETNLTKLKSMKTLDCDEKAMLFEDYLRSKGCTNIYIVSVAHKSGDYSHTFIIWNDKAFDPTSEPSAYDMEITNYTKHYLTDNGFTGLTTKTGC